MSHTTLFKDQRLLLYYKGDISALMLFAQQENASVCFPEPLPEGSEIIDCEKKDKVSLHPAVIIHSINRILKFEDDLLRLESGFREKVKTTEGIITVHMARFMLLDPPHKLMQSHQCKMKSLPELRGRPVYEMELLRRAYVKVMES